MKLPLHRDQAHRLRSELNLANLILADLQQLHDLGTTHTPDNDGYPHGSDGGTRTTDTTSTTERAALGPLDPGTRVLSDAIEHFFAGMKHLAAAHAKLGEYHRPRQLEPGRVSTVTTCPACGQLALPRAKSGYCEACYQAWRREGYPDRGQFEHERKRREDVA